MKKASLIISILLLVSILMSMTSCGSLPSTLKNKEQIGKAETFLDLSPADTDIKALVAKATASWGIALGDLDTDNVVTGYSKEDKTIYTIYYTSFSKNDGTTWGFKGSSVISSVEGISKKIISNNDFGDYNYGVIVVKGYSFSSSVDVLFILKNNKEVANYTDWKN